MESIILDNIPFQIEFGTLAKTLRLREGNSHVADLQRLVDQAHAIGKPKALYKMAFVEDKGDDYVVIDGITFNSRVLRVNLGETHRVFCFVGTCGLELNGWSQAIDDMLLHFWAEAINEMVLHQALMVMRQHLAEQYGLGQTGTMNPGSLADWPIKEQRKLFKLLGNTTDTIGVQLTNSMLMVPIKSVSGIHFPTEENFASCQLCPRTVCPNRRATYDPDLYERKYRPVVG